MSSVADSGPSIHLNQIRRLDLLALLAPLNVSTQVRAELVPTGVWSALRKVRHLDLRLHPIANRSIETERRRWAAPQLSAADLSVLALARRTSRANVLTDDLRLRRCVDVLGRRAIDSIGVLVRAYRLKKISSFQLRRAMSELFDDSSLYLSAFFREKVLNLIKEAQPERAA